MYCVVSIRYVGVEEENNTVGNKALRIDLFYRKLSFVLLFLTLESAIDRIHFGSCFLFGFFVPFFDDVSRATGRNSRQRKRVNAVLVVPDQKILISKRNNKLPILSFSYVTMLLVL